MNLNFQKEHIQTCAKIFRTQDSILKEVLYSSPILHLGKLSHRWRGTPPKLQEQGGP